MEHQPEPFYTATEKDMERVALHFVPILTIHTPTGFNTPTISRTITVGGRTVFLPIPLIDLHDGMAAVPMSYYPPDMESVLAGKSGPSVPGEQDALGVRFTSWRIADMKLGFDIPVEIDVVNPYGPALTGCLRRYVGEARGRGVHVAKAWAELVAGRHTAWLEQQRRREGTVDAEVVRPDPIPAAPRAIDA